MTAVFTGMRISELRGLTWANIDFARRIIRIRQRANRSNEIGSPKSKAGTRDIPMAPLVVEALERWRDDCPPGALGLVFPNGKGKPTDNAIIEAFNSRLRQECLNASWFLPMGDARARIEEWRCDYIQNRPHSALGGLTPAEFADQLQPARKVA